MPREDSARVRRGAVQAHPSSQRRLRGEPAQHQVGVGDRGGLAPAAVARGTGVGARRSGADPEHAPGVAPCDGPAARAHGVHVHHRKRQRTAAHLAPCAHRGAAADGHRHVAGRAAHVEAHGVARAHPGAHAGRAHGAARRTREHGPGRVASRRGGIGRAAAREHDLGGGQALVPATGGQALQVAVHQRGQRGIHHRGGAALVLTEHAGGLVRGGHVSPGPELLHQLRGPPLVAGMAKAPEQAHGCGLELQALEAAAQLPLVQLAEHPSGARALGHRDPQIHGHEWWRARRAQPVELRPGLAAELLDVGEALRNEQRRGCHAALEQRVRGHGHAVNEALHVARSGAGAVQRLAHRIHHALRLVRRGGGRLGDHQPVTGQERRVREGAAHVHPEDHGRHATRKRRRGAVGGRPGGGCPR